MLKSDVRQWLASLSGQTILFEDNTVSFLGRNGVYDSIGLHLMRLDGSPITGPIRLSIQPITSKGNLGRARLEIPLEAVSALVAALKDFLATARRTSKKLMREGRDLDWPLPLPAFREQGAVDKVMAYRSCPGPATALRPQAL